MRLPLLENTDPGSEMILWMVKSLVLGQSKQIVGTCQQLEDGEVVGRKLSWNHLFLACLSPTSDRMPGVVKRHGSTENDRHDKARQNDSDTIYLERVG